jgi:hypothetical protein
MTDKYSKKEIKLYDILENIGYINYLKSKVN